MQQGFLNGFITDYLLLFLGSIYSWCTHINPVRCLVEGSSPDKSNFMLWKLLRIKATEMARDNGYFILRLLLYVTLLWAPLFRQNIYWS